MGLVVKDKDGYRRKEDEEREIIEIKSERTKDMSEPEGDISVIVLIICLFSLYGFLYLLQFLLHFCIPGISNWLWFIGCSW